MHISLLRMEIAWHVSCQRLLQIRASLHDKQCMMASWDITNSRQLTENTWLNVSLNKAMFQTWRLCLGYKTFFLFIAAHCDSMSRWYIDAPSTLKQQSELLWFFPLIFTAQISLSSCCHCCFCQDFDLSVVVAMSMHLSVQYICHFYLYVW